VSSNGPGSAQLTDGGGNRQGVLPLFVNGAAGDYREARGSPTIDAGAATTINRALGFVLRSLGAGPDIGAYEYAPVPTAVSGSATDVSDSSATLNGPRRPTQRAFPSGFEYGTTTSYGRTATARALERSLPRSPELAPVTTYHYRLVATSPGAGTGRGQDRTFRTKAPAAGAHPPRCRPSRSAGAGASAATCPASAASGRRSAHDPLLALAGREGHSDVQAAGEEGPPDAPREARNARREQLRRGHKVRFEGRLTRRKKLRPGRYVLTVSVAGSTRSTSAGFTIVS